MASPGALAGDDYATDEEVGDGFLEIRHSRVIAWRTLRFLRV